jgi:hypothetical protein
MGDAESERRAREYAAVMWQPGMLMLAELTLSSLVGVLGSAPDDYAMTAREVRDLVLDVNRTLILSLRRKPPTQNPPLREFIEKTADQQLPPDTGALARLEGAEGYDGPVRGGKADGEAEGGRAMDYVAVRRRSALDALAERREHRPEQVDNESLPAGSPMYYYCTSCGHVSDTLPEAWFLGTPRELCTECAAMKDLGWLE